MTSCCTIYCLFAPCWWGPSACEESWYQSHSSLLWGEMRRYEYVSCRECLWIKLWLYRYSVRPTTIFSFTIQCMRFSPLRSIHPSVLNLAQKLWRHQETLPFKYCFTQDQDLSGRHEPVSPVATHFPINPDRSTLSPVPPVTASHGRAQRAVPDFITHPQGIFRRLKGGMQEHAAEFCPRAPVPWISLSQYV